MPILTKHQIVRITDVMMQGGGASVGHAGIVADHLPMPILRDTIPMGSYAYPST